jgi:hypothetical protein
MTPQEVAQLLTIDANITGRPIDGATVQIWHKILEHMPQEETLEALQEHYSESAKWVMPANLVTRVRQGIQDRRDRAAGQALAAIEAPVADPDSFAIREVRRLLQEVTPVIPKEDWPHPVIDDMSLPKKHACPACKAQVGIGCENRGNKQPLQGYHYSRLVKAGLAEPERPFDPSVMARLIAEYPSQVGESA